MPRWAWVLLAAIAAIALGGFFGPTIVSAISTVFTRGKRLNQTTPDAYGVVHEDPESLRRIASDALGYDIDLDTLALARALRSEIGRLHKEEAPLGDKQATGLALINGARLSGVSISRKLLIADAKHPNKQGVFAGQPGKYASTVQDPYEGDVEVALTLLTGAVPDFTNGAERYLGPSDPDWGTIASNWGKEGYVPIDVPNISPDFQYFRKDA